MKKLFALLLALLTLLPVFAGCTHPAATTDQPSENVYTGPEYTLAREEGTNQLTFYWRSPGADYAKCDMWIWYPGADGRGYLFHECAYGAKVVLNVPESITEVGFIVRKNCSDPGGTSWGDATKDYDGDRFAIITGETTEIYLKPGDAGQYFSTDGGKTLTQKKDFSLAAIIAENQIRYYVSPAVRFTSLDQIRVTEGDRQLKIKELSSLNNEVVLGTITLEESIDLSKTYLVHLDGFGEKAAMPTAIFDSDAFNAEYAYDGDDLGATPGENGTLFKVWAPTASEVILNLYEQGSGGSAYKTVPMIRGEKGVWSVQDECKAGVYYTYTVTTAAGKNEAVDPYARSAGVNGDRGMVVDLSSTDPEGFKADAFYSGITTYNQAIIWEVHVRDFSNKIADSRYPGKYLAFTETGLKNENGVPVGVDYLTDLGVTHVHFQPLYDFATVDESSDQPQFNWGYDPKNYNVPEGSYSTDPSNGAVRVNEFKQMVQALHAKGLGVVMDVVYNHTYDVNSNFNKIVPYYYYRYDASGAPSNGSGCGNETASERAMFRKFMVDSVVYWAKEYHIDGFRFDLMALHDVETMQLIESAVHAVNPCAILYGEGWTGGTSALRANLQANQTNISQIVPTGDGIGSVAVFNDAIRDGLKGSVFDEKGQGYVNGDPSAANAGKVAFGIAGGARSAAVGWSVNNNMVVNYMSCHDNHTLWDKLAISNPDNSEEERAAMNRLGASIVMISKGTPFFLAGEEMLRTKQGDHNSYNSSDEINNLDWATLSEGSAAQKMHDFYKGLIAMRKANAFLTTADVTTEIVSGNAIVVRYSENGALRAVAYVNPKAEAVDFTLPEGEFGVLLLGDSVSAAAQTTVSGSVTVPARGVFLAVL